MTSRKTAATRRHAKRKKTTPKPSSALPQSTAAWSRSFRIRVFILLGICCLLYATSLQWGRSGYVPWLPDSIEGVTIVRELPKTFDKWTYKYPRGYFVINGLFYKPLLDHWEKHPVYVGRKVPEALTVSRLDTLALITRWISMVMSVATVLGAVVVARALFDDDLVGLFAGMVVAFAPLYGLYCCSGCVDVPVMFFYTWATYAAIKAVRTDRWRHYLLLGFFAAWTVCIKEGVAAYVLALGIVTWSLMIEQNLRQGRTLKQAVLKIFSTRVLAALAVATVIFLLLNGFLAGPDEFLARMKDWKGAAVRFSSTFTTQTDLLWKSCVMLYEGIGWPFTLVWLASIAYFTVRYRWKLFIGLFPLVFFYVLTIPRIRLNAPRYMLPAYIGIALMIARTLVDLHRSRRIPAVLRNAVIVIVFTVPFLYCVGMALEKLDSTRVRAENWIKENADRNALIGAAMRREYATRLHYQGYRQMLRWHSKGIKVGNTTQVIFPDYLIVSTEWPCLPPENDSAFRQKLVTNQTEYKRVAQYNIRYLYPAKCILGWATWPRKRHPFLSPRMIIFEKDK